MADHSRHKMSGKHEESEEYSRGAKRGAKRKGRGVPKAEMVAMSKSMRKMMQEDR